MRIGEISQRTGVSTDLLRAWERRHGLLRPRRTDGRTRLYSAADETRVRLMQRYFHDGLPPAQAAEMVIAARLTVRPGQAASIPPADVAEADEEMHASLDRFDETLRTACPGKALQHLLAAHRRARRDNALPP
jgi:MerR family transcriptional regulator, light-induced transcriptional regulator